MPYAQRLKTFSCQGGRLRRGVCFPIYGLAAPAAGLAPVMFPRQRAVIESTSNTAGCLALSLGNVGPPSSMPLRILLPAIGSSGDVNPVIGLGRRAEGPGPRGHGGDKRVLCGQMRPAAWVSPRWDTRGRGRGHHARPAALDPWRGFECIVEEALLPNLRPLYEIIESAPTPRTVVAATTLCLGARVAQEKLGVPTATLHLQPTVFRSHARRRPPWAARHGPGHAPPLSSGRSSGSSTTLYVDRLIGPGFNAFRRPARPSARARHLQGLHAFPAARPRALPGVVRPRPARLAPQHAPDRLHPPRRRAGRPKPTPMPTPFSPQVRRPSSSRPGSAAMDRHALLQPRPIRACAHGRGPGHAGHQSPRRSCRLVFRRASGPSPTFLSAGFFPAAPPSSTTGESGRWPRRSGPACPISSSRTPTTSPTTASRIERLGLGRHVSDPCAASARREAVRALEIVLQSAAIRRRCAAVRAPGRRQRLARRGRAP